LKEGDPRMDRVARSLLAANKIWITTHVKADGDGIGSELALVRALRRMGKEVFIINDTQVPRALRFLMGDTEIATYDPTLHDARIDGADTIVVLDVGLTYRLGRLEAPFLRSGAVKICVDHHLETDSDFDPALTDCRATSTGEILFGLLKRMNAPMTRDVAIPLYASISVDSGNFSYERCTPNTFHTAAALVAAGADPYWIHLNLNWKRPMTEVKFDGEVINRLRVESNGEIAHSEVTQDMLRRYHIDPMEIPTVVNIPLSIEGVEIALLFVELEPLHIKVSARSKGRVQVSELAKRFGGGGHPLAAGFSVGASLDEARTRVLSEARMLIERAAQDCTTASGPV